MNDVYAKLEEAALYIERNPKLVKSITSFPYIVRSMAVGGPAALPAKTATAIVPIVFLTGDDPVKIGLVGSLNRPGGNLTGIVTLGAELGSKRLELVHELLPAAKIFALLVNPKRPFLAEAMSRDVQSAARTLGLQLHVLQATSERELEAVFANLRQVRADALVIGVDAFFNSQSEYLAALAVRYAVPSRDHHQPDPLQGCPTAVGRKNWIRR